MTSFHGLRVLVCLYLWSLRLIVQENKTHSVFRHFVICRESLNSQGKISNKDTICAGTSSRGCAWGYVPPNTNNFPMKGHAFWNTNTEKKIELKHHFASRTVEKRKTFSKGKEDTPSPGRQNFKIDVPLTELVRLATGLIMRRTKVKTGKCPWFHLFF